MNTGGIKDTAAVQEKFPQGMLILLGTAAIVIIIGGIYLAQSVVVVFLISIFLAMLGAPSLQWMKEKGIGTGIAVLIVMSVMLLIILLIGAQIGISFSSFTNALPDLQLRLREEVINLIKLLEGRGIVITEELVLGYFNPELILSLTANTISDLGSVLSDLLLVLLMVTFILLEVSSFPKKLRLVLGDPEKVFPEFTKFVIDMKRYMVLKTVINLTAGVLVGVWMLILGIPFPVLWGFLAFLLHYIPNIGAIVAVVPAALLALVQFGIGSALLVTGGNFVIGFIIGNVIEPRLMGRRLGLSTLVVFVSLLFWGSILGLVGAILCIPLTMTVKFAFEGNRRTRWIAVLLGAEK